MKLDGAHCDTTTAPSDIIGVPKEPAGHEDHKKSRFSDLAVIGTVKLSILTASTRSGLSQFFLIITIIYFWIFGKLRFLGA